VLNRRIDAWSAITNLFGFLAQDRNSVEQQCRDAGGDALERAEESTGVSAKRYVHPTTIQVDARSLYEVAAVLWAVSAMQTQSLASWSLTLECWMPIRSSGVGVTVVMYDT
jgi:hypothetical protein